jgi:three-Cys-motif partner protein
MAIQSQSYGSDDTKLKQAILQDYLRAYCTVMRKQPFHLTYIDAFAGSGFWTKPGSGSSEPGVALSVLRMPAECRFNRYVFGDIKQGTITSLRRAIAADRDAGMLLPPDGQIAIVRQDANELITQQCVELAEASMRRALMFIDPFGMSLNWQSVEHVAATGKIDLWLLIPTSMGPGRLIPEHGAIPPSWVRRLDRFWGREDWRDAFRPTQPGLFEAMEVRDADAGRIEEYALRRLRETFGDTNVHPKGLPLRGGRSNRGFLLTFACANKSSAAYQAALRIADYLLKNARSTRR